MGTRQRLQKKVERLKVEGPHQRSNHCCKTIFFYNNEWFRNKTWYIDSKVSQYLTFHKDVFFNCKIIPKKSIYVSDNYVQEAIVMGSVHLNMRMGEHEIKGVLHKVLHVPNLIKNIFQLVRLYCSRP